MNRAKILHFYRRENIKQLFTAKHHIPYIKSHQYLTRNSHRIRCIAYENLCDDLRDYDFDNSRHSDSFEIADKYQLFPSLEEWEGKILLLETSEETPAPDLFRKMIKALTDYGIFNVISGVLIGKPQDEVYYDEYKVILLEEVKNEALSILYNINVGHATPRCIVPFGVHAVVDTDKQLIRFNK